MCVMGKFGVWERICRVLDSSCFDEDIMQFACLNEERGACSGKR